MPRQAFRKPIAPIAVVVVIIIIIHLPAPNLPILMSTPNQPVPLIRNQTQRRRSPHRLPKRRTLLVPASRNNFFSSDAAPRRVQILEVPESHAALGSRPELRLARNNVPQETSNLSLPQRVRPQFKARRPRRVHRPARGKAEDAGAASLRDELRQRRRTGAGGVAAVAVVGGELPVEKLEHVIEAAVGGLDGIGGRNVVVGRGGVQVYSRRSFTVERGDVVLAE